MSALLTCAASSAGFLLSPQQLAPQQLRATTTGARARPLFASLRRLLCFRPCLRRVLSQFPLLLPPVSSLGPTVLAPLVPAGARRALLVAKEGGGKKKASKAKEAPAVEEKEAPAAEKKAPPPPDMPPPSGCVWGPPF